MIIPFLLRPITFGLGPPRRRKSFANIFYHDERQHKRLAREMHKASEQAQKLTGLRAMLMQKKRHHEKTQMKKTIKAHVVDHAKKKKSIGGVASHQLGST